MHLIRSINDLNLYNIGVLLHSNFQRRGVITEISKHLIEQIGKLKLEKEDGFIDESVKFRANTGSDLPFLENHYDPRTGKK